MRLARVESADDPVYNELLDKLQEIEPGLCLEFSAGRSPCELIVSADGNQELFPVARVAVGRRERDA
jgi:hypothetical protein